MFRGYRKWMVGALGATALVIPSAAANAQQPPVVPGCEQGCETAFSVSLPDGTRLDGLRTKTAGLLAYWDGTRLRDTTQVRGSDGYPYKSVESAVCGDSRCSVSFTYGAHSSAVASVSLAAKITVTDTVEGVSADVRDLNGDGQPDASLRQSTYYPSFAEAPLYWETYVERDGRFVRTGCDPSPAAPVTPASGACP
jgi:hypothetical protein